MSSNGQSSSGVSESSVRKRGRGKGKSAVPKVRHSTKVKRQITQKDTGGMPPKDKKRRKRDPYCHSVFIPEEAPLNEETLLCPKREKMDVPPDSLPDLSPSPEPSTSATLPSSNDIELPDDVDLGTNDVKLKDTSLYWLLEKDSDNDFDNTNDFDIDNVTQYIETTTDDNLTPNQVQILQTEEIANDTAIQQLLPDNCFNFEWTKDKSTFKTKREVFTAKSGPTFDITNLTPIDVFHKMFDVDFIDTLCDETNRYAQQKLDSLKESQYSRFHRWTPTDRPEIISFLSVMILQGLYPLHTEEAYFSFNGFGTMPHFNKIMSYNRFLLLKSMMHFADNNTDSKSRLFKIQSILDYFNRKLSSLYYPQRDIVIDESLLKQGRLSFAQNVNSKAQIGIKSVELCESSTGYVWQFKVYDGKNKSNDNDIERKDASTGHTLSNFLPTNGTAQMVFELVQPLLHRGHTLIMSSFYNCPLLARYLKQQNTDCYGMQRLSRKYIPTELLRISNEDLRHGQMETFYCSDLSLMLWRDTNLVSMISTFHSHQIGGRNETKKPSIVQDFNKNMAAIDRKDQLLSAQPIDRMKSHVWFKKIFRRLFNVAVHNCYVIHHSKHTKMSQRQFRTIMAEDLLKTFKNIDLTMESRLIITKPSSSKSSITTVRRNARFTMSDRPIVESNHFPMRSASRNGRCWWCLRNQKVKSRTVWQCIECQVYLCIVGCFRDFHKP